MMSKEEITEFQQRRAKWLRRAIPSVALFLIGALIGVTTGRFNIGFYFAIVSFIGWSYFTWRLYRCPRCNKIPSSGKGVVLNPKFCQNCGAQLRSNV